jgi:hypothetical protein
MRQLLVRLVLLSWRVAPMRAEVWAFLNDHRYSKTLRRRGGA